MKRITTITLLLVAPVVVCLILYQFKPWSSSPLAEMLAERERESYEIVSRTEDPLIRALFTGAIHADSPIESVIENHKAQWTESYGPYTVYGFDERGYSSRTLVAHEGRVVRASVGSCTWDWTFFDKLPLSDATKISHIRHLRIHLARHPEHSELIQKLIEDQLAGLSNATKHRPL